MIEVLWEARAEEHEAQLRQLRLALQWALLHPCVAGERPASWGEPGLLQDTTRQLAGAGAPLVAAQAPWELAAALDRPVAHAEQLIADALELAFRLPRLWGLLGEAQVPVWTAGLMSRETHDLRLDAALHADRLICAVPAKIAQLGVATAARLVHEARLHADPDRAQAEEDAALAHRGVWLRRRAAPATSEVSMTLDTADANLFDQTVSRIAADLKDLGDTETLDVRRARAVGVLADPQYALDLMSGRTEARPTRGGTGAMDLVLHLHPSDLHGEPGEQGVAVAERLGAVSMRLLAQWLGDHLDAGGRVSLRARSSTWPRRAVTTSTTHRHGCSSRSCSAMPTASSPAATATPGPGPHRGLRPATSGRTARSDDGCEPGAAVPPPPQRQDPSRLDLPATRQQLHLDLTHRPPLRRHPRLPHTDERPKNLTA